MKIFEKLDLKMKSLVVFRDILKDENIQKLSKLLTSIELPIEQRICRYADFAYGLFKTTDNLTEYIWKLVLSDENIYVLKKAKDHVISPMLDKCLSNELNILQLLSSLKSEDVKKQINYDGFLPEWTNDAFDFESEFKARMDCLSTVGYGQFVDHLMFIFENDKLIPVKCPDHIRLSHLWGYESSRNKVIANTLSLLENRPSSNVLLYGDAGTGKSSTVKAIVNEYGSRGLRLVEIRKTQLLQIPTLLDILDSNPLKFIIFIDDLSFAQNNEAIGSLKAILEGTASAKPPNTVIYATSNRRHLIKETFSDRGDDDLHRSETIQEQTSLSDRFGLSVSFFKPDKDEYLDIVFALANQYHLKDTEGLELLAERYALERGGRSGRVARQLIESLACVN